MAEAATPLSDHRASASYRSAMLRTSLLKFYAEHAGHAVDPAGDPAQDQVGSKEVSS